MTTFTMTAAALKELAIGAITCIGTDQMLPVLEHAKITVEGNTVTVTTTDRFQAAIGVFESDVTDTADGTFLAPIATLKEWAKIKTTRDQGTLAVIVTHDGDWSLTWTTNGASATVRADYDVACFPRVERIIPTEEPTWADTPFGINLGELARWSKLAKQWRFAWTGKHLYGTPTDYTVGQWRLLRMPFRLAVEGHAAA